MSQLERRDFLKLGGTVLISSLIPPELFNALPPERNPRVEQVKTWNRDPEFWRSIFVRQHDPLQYSGYDNPDYPLESFMKNACGLASLTLVRRWAEYIFTGDTSEKTNIINTAKSLAGKTYVTGRNNNENPIINSDGRPFLYPAAIKKALEVLDSETQYYKVVEITPPLVTSRCKGVWGLCIDNAHQYWEWQELFDRTSAGVISKGGITVVFIAKYWWGHISVCPFIPADRNEDVLYVDPKGYDKNGIIEMGPLSKYTHAVASIYGVIPNLPPENRRKSLKSS